MGGEARDNYTRLFPATEAADAVHFRIELKGFK